MSRWVTSSYCAADKPQCVQVRAEGGEVHVSDSKNPDGAVLIFAPQEWEAFTAGAKKSEFDTDRLTENPMCSSTGSLD